MNVSFAEWFQCLLRPPGQSRTARTVEWFGWLLLVESPILLVAPRWAAGLLGLPDLGDPGVNYFRLVGLLVGGLGMLYVVSGRLNAEGFLFASLLDRPLVPIVMTVLWSLGLIPGPLALAFSLEDTASFLWTLLTWRAERAAAPA